MASDKDGEHGLNRRGFANGAINEVKFLTLPLMKALGNEPGFETFKRTIGKFLDPVNPLAADNMKAQCSFDELPSLISMEGVKLFAHRSYPSRISECTND